MNNPYAPYPSSQYSPGGLNNNNYSQGMPGQSMGLPGQMPGYGYNGRPFGRSKSKVGGRRKSRRGRKGRKGKRRTVRR